MATATELMASGLQAEAAAKLGEGAAVVLAPAGSNQATAAALTSSFVTCTTTPASTGWLLKQARGQPVTVIYNGGSNTAKIYGNGSETINGIAAATGISLPTLKAAILVASNNQWIALVSA